LRYLLDTDVLIEVFRDNVTVHDQIWQLRHNGHVLCYSPVTRAEVFASLRPGEEVPVAQILARLTCMVIDGPVGEQAGRFLNTYRGSHGLKIGDALIAASAVLAEADLITFNEKHYPMPEIKLHRLKR